MSRPTREQVARALFWHDADPGDDAVGERLWANICQRTGDDSEWHRAADAVVDLFPEPPTGDAEAEAERRYADCHDDRRAFVAGATWQAQQPREVVTTAAEFRELRALLRYWESTPALRRGTAAAELRAALPPWVTAAPNRPEET